MKLNLKLHKHQRDFIYTPGTSTLRTETVRGFVAGRGSGKSVAGALDLGLRAMLYPGPYGMYAPTYPLLEDATLATFKRHWQPYIVDESVQKRKLTMSSGSEIRCRSLEDPDSARGPSQLGAWIDEASLVRAEAFMILLGTLRYEGRMGWLTGTFTPRGKGHWTHEQFTTPPAVLIQARTRDNPFRPDGFDSMIRARCTSALAQQELDGEFISMGNTFKREWFRIIPAAPKQYQARARAWDMAATAQKSATDDPDWTAGCLMAVNKGVVTIEDMRHVRAGPQDTERRVVQSAQLDGKGAMIRQECEGGSAGKTVAEHYSRLLSGWDFRAVSPTGDKVDRAWPFAAAAEAGNVQLVAGPWNKAFLDEIEAFPGGKHDDQVDAAAYAFAAVTERANSAQVHVW